MESARELITVTEAGSWGVQDRNMTRIQLTWATFPSYISLPCHQQLATVLTMALVRHQGM